MAALRLMSFNTRLLPSSISNDGLNVADLLTFSTVANARGGTIGRAVRADPWADIIGFCEVWEDLGSWVNKGVAGGWLIDPLNLAGTAREGLEDALGDDIYRYWSPSTGFGVYDVVEGVFSDSGLVFAAKSAPLPLPSRFDADARVDDFVAFERFDHAEGSDAKSAKGAIIARWETSVGFTTIVMTHLQASYLNPHEYDDVRHTQLRQIGELIERMLGPKPWADDERIVIMGDLNIPGNDLGSYPLPDSSPVQRWVQLTMLDAWRAWMPLTDPGLTQTSWTAVSDPGMQRNRLDFQLVYDPQPQVHSGIITTGGRSVRKMVAQHMQLAHRDLSDHVALRGSLAEWQEHNTPQTALAPKAADDPWLFVTHQREQMTWLYFPRGAYTFVAPAPATYTVYGSTNISDPWAPYGRVDLATIPNAASVVDKVGAAVGDQFSAPEPFFVRLTAADDYSGALQLGWYRHVGDSPDDPIPLTPNTDAMPMKFPSGTPNDFDELWFSLKVKSGPRQRTLACAVEITNHQRKNLSASVRNDAMYELGRLDRSRERHPRLEAGLRGSADGHRHLLSVARDRNVATSFEVRWLSPITYLHPHLLRCDNETGWDAVGSDEIYVRIDADAVDSGNVGMHDEDVDLGESIPLSTWPPIAFIEKAVVDVEEDEDVIADDTGDVTIRPLESEQATEEETLGISVGSGEYTFAFHRSRWIPGD